MLGVGSERPQVDQGHGVDGDDHQDRDRPRTSPQQCRPGDHFPVDQASTARQFVSLEPLPLPMSGLQRVANVIGLFALLVTAGGLLLPAVLRLVRSNRET